MSRRIQLLELLTILLIFFSCDKSNDVDVEDKSKDEKEEVEANFYFGADLSYVNQILDYNGVYKDEGEVRDPYRIFSDRGTDVVRLRLWHDPQWTKTVYDPPGDQLYNDLYDVERAIEASKSQNMGVLLDFHYSDVWADPGHQKIPAAWAEIKDIDVLKDSVYNYTYKVLAYLDGKGLMPEFVQIGNETNCGMLYHEAATGDFPSCNGCDGNWNNLRQVMNSGIAAVRDVSSSSTIETKVILHVADPKNVEWFFDNLTAGVAVKDFDIIGFSYYPIWHDDIPLSQLADKVKHFKEKFNKDIMILEAAYPWTLENNDSNGNIFGDPTPVNGYPFTNDGQLKLMKDMTQALMDGGGIGIFYWEPAWITSDLNDLWSTGSSWENCTFFDYNGNAHQGFDFMTYEYD